MFIRNGKRFDIKRQHTFDGITFPVGYFITEDARAKYGITEISEPTRKNEKFYTVTEIDDSPYIQNTPKELSQVKKMLSDNVKVKRDDLWVRGGFEVNGKWYASDAQSKTQYLFYTSLGSSIPANTQWKTKDGSFVTLTQSLLSDMIGASIAQETAIFDKAQELLEEIDSATTVDSLAELNWEDNWPNVYNVF